MQIVIDIPEDTYYDMKAHEEQIRLCDNKFKTAVVDGTPLAKVIEGIKTEIKELANYDTVDTLVEILRVIDKHTGQEE